MIKAWKNDKKHCLIYQHIFIHTHSFMKLNSEPEKGGAGSHPRWNAGKASGLASSRAQEAGSSTWVEHCARLLEVELSLNGQAMSCMSIAPPPPPPPPPNTNTNTNTNTNCLLSATQICKAFSKMKNAPSCWLFGHCSWDAEGCWWGRSWTCKKPGRGCFWQWYDSSRLGELHPESI